MKSRICITIETKEPFPEIYDQEDLEAANREENPIELDRKKVSITAAMFHQEIHQYFDSEWYEDKVEDCIHESDDLVEDYSLEDYGGKITIASEFLPETPGETKTCGNCFWDAARIRNKNRNFPCRMCPLNPILQTSQWQPKPVEDPPK